jgi:hypothetical protein
MPITPKQQYTDSLNSIAARYGSMEDATIKRIVREIQQLRKDLAAEFTAPQTAAGQWRIKQQLQAADRLINELEMRLKTALDESTTAAFTDGGAAVVEPLRKIGLQNAFFSPNISQLNTILDFNSALIKNITEPLRAQVNRQIRDIGLGQITPTQAMQQLTQVFGKAGVEQGKMVTSGISAKAEADIRTELQRVYNLSNHAQQLATDEQIPGLLKTWIATADSRTRKGHLEAHRRYHATPIPIKQLFEIYDIRPNGTRTGKVDHVMYPVDPRGAAWNTINCRCRMATIHPEIGVIGSSLDGRIARMMEA